MNASSFGHRYIGSVTCEITTTNRNKAIADANSMVRLGTSMGVVVTFLFDDRVTEVQFFIMADDENLLNAYVDKLWKIAGGEQ